MRKKINTKKILPKIKGTQFYKVGDKVEAIQKNSGAWFSADIIDISPASKCECVEVCHCTYKLLFEGSENEEVQIVERKLHEIRQVSYSSIDWENLEVGMTVVINYNVEKPKQWGYWYDYVIEDLQKRDGVIYAKGTLMVGLNGNSKRITVKIDSDNVSDVLEIRPHVHITEKEKEGYETGVKPEYCCKCRNKPKVKCRTCCCCKCGNKKDFELTVQCDECDAWYHIYCLDPPLEELPNDDDDWYCPKCNNETYRAKLEMKQKIKKQKLENKSTKSSGEVSKRVKNQAKKPEPDFLEENEDDFMEDITKEIPKDSKVWKEVQKLYSGYEILRVVAEVIRKKDEELIKPEVAELIYKDVANEHLWKEAKEYISKGKEVFLDAVKRIFSCAICCEVLNDPITLSCKHNFCIDCFFRSLSVNVYNCSLCRVDVIHTQHYVVNENLKKALALLFGKKLSKKIDA